MREVRLFTRFLVRRAFSLVELIIAMAILSFLAVMLFSILSATSDLWKSNEEAVSGFREARAALNVIARDIAQGFADPAGQLPDFIVNPAYSSVVLPSEASVNPAWGSRLFILSTFARSAQESVTNRSHLCAVGYYLAFTRDSTVFSPNTSGNGDFSYKLYRHFKSSDQTFAALTSAMTKGTETTPDIFDSKKIYTPTIASSGAGDEILARNVNQFRLKFFKRVTDATTNRFTGVEEIDLSTKTWPVNERPAMVEITLTALPDRAAAKLIDQAAWDNHASTIQIRAARAFVSRVTVP